MVNLLPNIKLLNLHLQFIRQNNKNMKKTILINLIFLLIFSLTTLAQNDTSAEVEWKDFQPKGEEYSLQVPSDLTRTPRNNQENNQSFSVKLNNQFFFIFSENIKSRSPDKTIKKFLTDADAKPIKVKIDNFAGEKYSFKYSDDYFHTLLLIKTKSKIYAFHTASEKEDDDVIDKFFKGIKFDRKLSDDNAKIELPKAVDNGSIGISGIKREQNATTDSGQSNSVTKPVDSVNTTLKIVSKSHANYTDYARFFNIQGTVQLSVIFLSTGEIGAVEAVKKLPFGLTANSIEAARKMRFEPMRKDGTAINASKLVEYTFTIY